MVILKELQDLRNMLEMRFPRLTVDEDVFKEDKDKVPEKRFQNFIHEALEGGRGITKNSQWPSWVRKSILGMPSYFIWI